MANTNLGKKLTGFPQTQLEMAEWEKKYKFDVASGAWYEPTPTPLAPSVTPPLTSGTLTTVPGYTGTFNIPSLETGDPGIAPLTPKEYVINTTARRAWEIYKELNPSDLASWAQNVQSFRGFADLFLSGKPYTPESEQARLTQQAFQQAIEEVKTTTTPTPAATQPVPKEEMPAEAIAPAPTPTPTPTVAPAAYTGPSIVDYLKSINQPSDFNSRAALAAQKGIANYTGTAEQNTQLLNMLRGETTAPTEELPPEKAEAIQKGITSVAEAIEAMKAQIETEGITTTDPTTGETIYLVEPGGDVNKVITASQKDIKAKTDEIAKDLATGQTGAELTGDMAAYERMLDEQKDLFKQYSDKITKAVTDYQASVKAGLEEVKAAYEPIKQKYESISQFLTNQTSMVDQYKQMMADAGVPEKQAELARLQAKATAVEEQIETLPEDVKNRVKNFLITQSQYERITAAEAEPLTKLYNAIARAGEATAADINARRAEVSDALGWMERDLARTEEALKWGLEGAKTIADLETRLAEAGIEYAKVPFEMATELAGKEMELGAALSAKAFELSQAELEYLRGLPAEQADIAYKEALTKKALEPEEAPTSIIEANGRVLLINTQTGETIKDLGMITEDPNVTKKQIVSAVNSTVDQYRLNPEGFRERYIKSLVSTFGENFRDYITEQVYALMPDVLPPELDKWEKEGIVWQWLETDEAKGLSDDEKASYIRQYGLNPETFGVY